MGVGDGTVIGATKILDNGDPGERFNLVLVAEGYKQSELNVFHSDCQFFMDGLFGTVPYNKHRCAINVWRVDVASKDSGADDPAACGGTGATPKTYFDATFCTGGVPRALTCNTSLVLTTVSSLVPEFHSAQVIVNSPKYGGTGGTVGVSSTATKKADGTAVDWREILIHEMGHSIYGLADEYAYYQGCEFSENNHYTGGEPDQPNITASPVAAGKWNDLINTSPLPTTHNPDCAHCPPEINPPPAEGLVGTYEGAGYYHCGMYRPSYNCKMRKLDEPFCAVCRREIHEYLLTYDPDFCAASLVPPDTSKWVAVATILWGVIQDGGGVVFVGGRPIPIDPWGPLRNSIWEAMAHPQDAHPAVRDTIVGLALAEIASLVSSQEHRERIGSAAQNLVQAAAGKLPAKTIV